MWAAIGPPRRHKTYSLYALFLSIFCRNTAAFFFFSSSDSRFNSLTIAISLAGSLSATASRQRSRQSFRASWVMMPPKSERNIVSVITQMLGRKDASLVQNSSSCANLPTVPPRDNLHSKNESGASGRVLRLRCYAPLRLGDRVGGIYLPSRKFQSRGTFFFAASD